MLKLVTLLLLVAAACSAAPSKALARPLVRGRPRLDGRIVGGEPVDISQFPWQVSMQLHGSHDCGGSVISSDWVLTAAHCIVKYELSSLSIRAGTSIRESGGAVFDVSNGCYHDDFDRYTTDFDIAVLQISGSFSFGSNIQAVALGTSEPSAGAEAIVTGWGTLFSGGSLPDQLQAVATHIVSRSDCSDSYSGEITERMICAGEPEGGKDSCQGDSGGPLVIGSTQYGIVSWGTGCAKPRYPGVYTNVAYLRSWVSEAAGV